MYSFSYLWNTALCWGSLVVADKRYKQTTNEQKLTKKTYDKQNKDGTKTKDIHNIFLSNPYVRTLTWFVRSFCNSSIVSRPTMHAFIMHSTLGRGLQEHLRGMGCRRIQTYIHTYIHIYKSVVKSNETYDSQQYTVVVCLSLILLPPLTALLFYVVCFNFVWNEY